MTPVAHDRCLAHSNLDSPQSEMSCRIATAVLACVALSLPSHGRAAAASSPVLTASMAIVHAPMLLITLRPSRETEGSLRAFVAHECNRLPRNMPKHSASYTVMLELDSHGIKRLGTLAAGLMPWLTHIKQAVFAVVHQSIDIFYISITLRSLTKRKPGVNRPMIREYRNMTNDPLDHGRF